MPPVGFEPTIAAGERPKTYALDRAATGTGVNNREQSCKYRNQASPVTGIQTLGLHTDLFSSRACHTSPLNTVFYFTNLRTCNFLVHYKSTCLRSKFSSGLPVICRYSVMPHPYQIYNHTEQERESL
jgi:hypothetical protein